MRTFECGVAQLPLGQSALTRPFSSPWSERFARLSFWKPAAFVWKKIESVNVWLPTTGLGDARGATAVVDRRAPVVGSTTKMFASCCAL